MADVPGIDVPAVSKWLEDRVPGAKGPFHYERIAGGHSNLTYRVESATTAPMVLRRPPLGHVLASAHDMGREYRIISGLARSDVPVPPALGFCDDAAVNGAPFYVMAYVDGYVVRSDEIAAAALVPSARAEASRALVDTLAAIHGVDLDVTGLSQLGRHEGYIPRQLKRWYGQWNQQRTRDLPAVDRVHDALRQLTPDQQEATIVHGDYRLDNCILGGDGSVRAVLDWEICTLGDPLADLGMLMVYWTGPGDETSAWPGGRATTLEGFWNRDRISARYADVSGRDLGALDFYVSFAFWKLACILEGVYSRYLGGALGDRERSELEPFARQVEAAAHAAEQRLELVK
ncbi:phosphotransferase family protein [soil metagenome]